MQIALTTMTLFSLTLAADLGRDLRVDLDGDGRIERVVGSPRGVSGGVRTGTVEVLGADGQVRFRLAGDSRGDRFGWSVCVAADVDGDGVRDVAVGAPLNDAAGNASGSAFLFSGKTGRQLWVAHGTASRQQFGYAVKTVADLDGDGTADLAVGAPFAARGGARHVGYVRVLSGRTGRPITTRHGANAGAQHGRSLLARPLVAVR